MAFFAALNAIILTLFLLGCGAICMHNVIEAEDRGERRLYGWLTFCAALVVLFAF